MTVETVRAAAASAVRRLALWAVLASLAAGAAAHDMWIVPPAGAEPGAPLRVDEAARLYVRVGDGGRGERVRRDPRWLRRFAALRLDDADPRPEVPVPGLPGADPAGVLRPDRSGLWAVVFEGAPALSVLPAARFEEYLAEEGLEGVAAERRRRGEEGTPGRELFSRSLKGLFRVGAGGASEAADRLLGLPLELVAERDPTSLAGGDLPLRLYFRGAPLAGALVDLRRLDQDEPAAAERTGADGRVRFTGVGAGAWVAAVVHLERSAAPEAEWRSYFATLTFTAP